MQVIVVGAGKLAKELLARLAEQCPDKVTPWLDSPRPGQASIVVHAGSGRELEEVIAYCRETRSTLIELATTTDTATRQFDFPVVLCPNTNILMLKFMAMLARSGHLFKGYRIEVAESHQADKSSTPGTAVSLAQSLGLHSDEIASIRDPVKQGERLKIPQEHLSRHAYHRIMIEDQLSSITLETRVLGPAPYAQGVARIISAIASNRLERRHYSVLEFVDNGWV